MRIQRLRHGGMATPPVLLGGLAILWASHMPSEALGASPFFAVAYRSFEVGSTPGSIAVGDLNEDGVTDVITGNVGTRNLGNGTSITVLIGSGDGGFRPRMDIALHDDVHLASLGDIDGDGHLDLVVVTIAGVQILPGRGDGTFSQAREGLPLFSLVLQIADLNCDGRSDLLLAVSQSIRPYLSNGDWTFTPGVAQVTPGYPQSLAVVYLDHDGHADVVAGISSQRTSLFYGDGHGGLIPGPGFATGGGPVTATDLDGNGWGDLVVYAYPSRLVVAMGHAAGFAAPIEFTTLSEVQGLATGDFNEDGYGDVFVGVENGVSIFLGNPSGTLDVGGYTPGPPYNRCIAVGDFGRDGHMDVAVAEGDNSYFWGNVHVFRGSGDGSLGGAAETKLPGFVTYWMDAGDVNGDDLLDLACVEAKRDSLCILLGRGDNTFRVMPRISTSSDPSIVQTSDLNRDGMDDVLVYGFDNRVSVHLGTTTGVLQPGPMFVADPGLGWMILSDLNGDGRADWIGVKPDWVTVRLGAGDGSFGSQSQASAFDLDWIAPGDVNGDGALDLSFVTQDPWTDVTEIWLLRGLGNGTFSSRSRLVTIPHIRCCGFAVGDVSGDGRLDLIMGVLQRNQFLVFAGHGDGTFEPSVTYPSVGEPAQFMVSDLNGDEHPDIVMASINYSSRVVSTFIGMPDGTLAGRTDFGGGNAAKNLVLGDFNEDERPDLALSVCSLRAGAVVLENLPPPVAHVATGPTSARNDLRIEPNPAASHATVRFRMPAAGPARLEVFDVAGHRVATAAEGSFGAGEQLQVWRGRSESGDLSPPGLYFLRLTTPWNASTARLVWLGH